MTTATDNEPPAVTVVAAAPGFQHVTLWWDDLNDPNPSMSRQDIIAWQITTSYSDTKHAHVSSAEPICPDFILSPVDGGDAAIVGPSGVAVVV